MLNKKEEMSALFVYSPDMNSVFHVQAVQLSPTEGSVSLLKNYEAYGAYMRKEHYICSNNIKKSCPHGRRCRDIHLAPDVSLSQLPTNLIHRNARGEKNNGPLDDEALQAIVSQYSKHPPGRAIEVFDHKSRKSIYVDSGNVIVTAGSEEHYRHQGGDASCARMQQCTHFHRKCCLRGPLCAFLHVLHFNSVAVGSPPVQDVQPMTTPVGLELVEPHHRQQTVFPVNIMSSMEGHLDPNALRGMNQPTLHLPGPNSMPHPNNSHVVYIVQQGHAPPPNPAPTSAPTYFIMPSYMTPGTM